MTVRFRKFVRNRTACLQLCRTLRGDGKVVNMDMMDQLLCHGAHAAHHAHGPIMIVMSFEMDSLRSSFMMHRLALEPRFQTLPQLRQDMDRPLLRALIEGEIETGFQCMQAT